MKFRLFFGGGWLAVIQTLKGGGAVSNKNFRSFGPQFGLKIGGGGGAGLPWIGHCWSFYNFVDPLLRDPVMVTQDHRPEKNSKGR